MKDESQIQNNKAQRNLRIMTSVAPPPSAPFEENYEDIGSNPGIPNDPDGKSSPKASDKVIGAAAIAGGVAGLAVCGPLAAVAGAIGAGALATQSNTAGNVARASGNVVIATGERAKKLDKKHHIVEKTKKAAGTIAKNAKEFEEKHHLGEKAGKGLKNGLDFVSKKIKPKGKKIYTADYA